MWQSLGFHLIKNKYSSPVPDTRTLKEELWERHSELRGIDFNGEGQCELLADFVARFKDEYKRLPVSYEQISKPHEYFINNGYFESVDGEMLYCMIRSFKPRRIFEIGSGYSTLLSTQAALKNSAEDGSYECELVAIEPYLRANHLGDVLTEPRLEDRKRCPI